MSTMIIEDGEVTYDDRQGPETSGADRRRREIDDVIPGLQIVPVTPTEEQRGPMPGRDFDIGRIVPPIRGRIEKRLPN